MATRKQTLVPFQRRLQGKTDYKKRLLLLKARTTRLVVRPTLKNIYVQFVDFNPTGDLIRCHASAYDLRKQGWQGSGGNVPAAYLAGLLAGKRAKAKGISNAILDIGMLSSVKGSRLYAALKGALDAGVQVPCSKEVLPKEERISGAHIASYAKHTQSIGTGSAKKGSENITEQFTDIKKKILSAP